LTTCAASGLTLEAVKLFRYIITVVCVVTPFIANAGGQLTANAKDAINPSTNAELQLLQGTWEEIKVADKGTSKSSDSPKTSELKSDEMDVEFLKTEVSESPHELPPGKITITITGDSFHFYRDTNFWFDTTITLPAGKDPKQLIATITGCPPSQGGIGKVVRAFFKIEDGTLTLAAMGSDADETSKGFDAAVENRYELRKIQPQKKDAQANRKLEN